MKKGQKYDLYALGHVAQLLDLLQVCDIAN